MDKSNSGLEARLPSLGWCYWPRPRPLYLRDVVSIDAGLPYERLMSTTLLPMTLMIHNRFIAVTAFLYLLFILRLEAAQSAGETTQWSIGFGTLTSSTLLSPPKGSSAGNRGVIINVLVANLIQPVLSFVYLVYNSSITSIVIVWEWAAFATEYKGLRVSKPPR